MQTKLTLRLDDSLIKFGKEYSKIHGKSLSQMVSDYLYLLHENQVEVTDNKAKAPITDSLRGVLSGKANIDEGDYKSYLEGKYL